MVLCLDTLTHDPVRRADRAREGSQRPAFRSTDIDATLGSNPEFQGRTTRMAPHTWLLLTVASAFLLLGVAGSPLAWAALHLARKRHQQFENHRIADLLKRLSALETLLGFGTPTAALEPGAPERASTRLPRGGASGTSRPHSPAVHPDHLVGETARTLEPTLIAVPQLGPGPTDKDAVASGMSQRYAAIWALADNGSRADVIARATGQPIGQIELILGLRRQIDGQRTTISHGSHG
jgi:hypothetical protein